MSVTTTDQMVYLAIKKENVNVTIILLGNTVICARKDIIISQLVKVRQKVDHIHVLPNNYSNLLLSSKNKNLRYQFLFQTVIVILLVWLKVFQVVVRYLQVNSVNVKNELKEESVTNADRCSGILISIMPMVAKSVIVTEQEF